jgi:hypothetical protein
MVLPSLSGEEARFSAYVEGLTSVIGMRIGLGRFAVIALA